MTICPANQDVLQRHNKRCNFMCYAVSNEDLLVFLDRNCAIWKFIHFSELFSAARNVPQIDLSILQINYIEPKEEF